MAEVQSSLFLTLAAGASIAEMGETRLIWRVTVLLGAFGLVHCSQAANKDEGASGDDGTGALGGASATGGTGGVSATGGASATGGTGGVSGAGGTGSSLAGAPCAMPEILTVKAAPPAGIDEATFIAQWPALECTAMKPCCAAKGGVAYDEPKCLAYAATVFQDTGMLYDAIEAAQCLESLKAAAASCSGELGARGTPTSCSYVYRGSAALAASCSNHEDCAPDARGPSFCDSLTHTCAVDIRGKLGDACNRGCEPTTDFGICYAPANEKNAPGVTVTCRVEDGLRCTDERLKGVNPGTCQPAAALGCGCQQLTDDSALCNGSGYCDTDAYVCRPRGGVGTPCRLDQVCAVDLYCPDSTGTAVCTPRKHAGEPCTVNDECYGGGCQLGACVLDNSDERNPFRDIYCDGVGTE